LRSPGKNVESTLEPGRGPQGHPRTTRPTPRLESAYGRLRRALDTGNPTIAFAAAAESSTSSVSLTPSSLVLLLVDGPRRFRRAALRWHAPYCAEVPEASRKGSRARPSRRFDRTTGLGLPRRAGELARHERLFRRATLFSSYRK
jgi:hypothetical protein